MFPLFAVTDPHIPADTTSPTQWAVLAAAVLGTAIVLFKPKFRARKDPLQKSPQSASLAQQRSVERQMQNLLIELSEMARQVTAGLDTRAAKLDALIQEADEKIAALRSLRIDAVSAEPASPPRERPVAMKIADSDPLPETFDTRSNSRADLRSAPQADSPTETQSAGHRDARSTASPYDSNPRHLEVYLLSDEGHTSGEIAARLHRPSGEIQLILALRARQS